jgi:hypothetical protein
MRKLALILLLPVFAASSATAQSNTTAGLAGVGAGAALNSAAGQGGTTPSSAAVAGGGGGGTATPIEIQIMAFQGLRDIARDVAELTLAHEGPCIPPDGNFEELRRHLLEASARLERDRKTLEYDRRVLEDDEAASNQGGASTPDLDRITQDRQTKRQDEAAVHGDTDNFNVAVRALDNAINGMQVTNPRCAILIEDPTSANQIALYQAVQGYYDHLKRLDDHLQEYFALQVVQSPASLSWASGAEPSPQDIKVVNISRKARAIKEIEATGSDAFQVDPSDCYSDFRYVWKVPFKILDANQWCDVRVTFPAPDFLNSDTAPAEGITYSAKLTILSGEADSTDTDTKQTVQLTATVAKAQKKIAQEPGTRHFFVGPAPGAATTAPTATAPAAPTTGGGGAATTPIGLTYLSDLTTALGALKSSITYGPSSFQPTTQGFVVLVEAELEIKGIFPYTSTSALDLDDARKELTRQFGEILLWSNDVTGWTSQCKPTTPSGNQGATNQSGNNQGSASQNGSNQGGAPSNSACTKADVVVDLAVAQQLINGYTALVSSANDGSGNPVIVDVLRGGVLSKKMSRGISSLQVSVAAAGGSTKTNSIFGANLFYTFAPSYNAGVIATFELRDVHNVLLESGARNVLFAYRKWKSRRFHPGEMKHAATCGSFCSEESP